jgi:hypothetical protein
MSVRIFSFQNNESALAIPPKSIYLDVQKHSKMFHKLHLAQFLGVSAPLLRDSRVISFIDLPWISDYFDTHFQSSLQLIYSDISHNAIRKFVNFSTQHRRFLLYLFYQVPQRKCEEKITRMLQEGKITNLEHNYFSR